MTILAAQILDPVLLRIEVGVVAVEVHISPGGLAEGALLLEKKVGTTEQFLLPFESWIS